MSPSANREREEPTALDVERRACLVDYFVVVSSLPRGDENERTLLSDEDQNVPPSESSQIELPTDSLPDSLFDGWRVLNSCLCNPLWSENLSESEEIKCNDEPSGADTEVSSLDGNSGKESSVNEAIPSDPLSLVDPKDEKEVIKLVTFQAEVTARYPLNDIPSNPLNPAISQFCHPSTEEIHVSTGYQIPLVHHFILTDEKGRRTYGTCLTVDEEYCPKSTDNKTSILWWYRHRVTVDDEQSSVGIEYEGVEVTICPDSQEKRLYLPKVLCILSSWPYLSSFRSYLTQLHRLATTTKLMSAPIERYILNICHEVPAPIPDVLETHVNLGLDHVIRFRAASADQPVPSVALRFQTLFECLDTGNMLQVWYALTLEQKVILVSSQKSILCVCAEVLRALLFPLHYCHAYVPLLPVFLLPLLEAPMPYFCGVPRCVFEEANSKMCISDDVLVVDLDNNTVISRGKASEITAIPEKLRVKLQDDISLNGCNRAFWRARGCRSETDFAHLCEKIGDIAAAKEARRLWGEKLMGFDDAYSEVMTPNVPGIFAKFSSEEVECKWESVQDAFLMFYASVLMNYKKFIIQESLLKSHRYSADSGKGHCVWKGNGRSFLMDLFIDSGENRQREFLQEFCFTQHFAEFIYERLHDPSNPEVTYFDECIEVKKNMSIFRMKKVETPFLHRAKEHKNPRVFSSIEPNSDFLSYQGAYTYSIWPQRLNSSLFCSPRPLPHNIVAGYVCELKIDQEKARAQTFEIPQQAADFYTMMRLTLSSLEESVHTSMYLPWKAYVFTPGLSYSAPSCFSIPHTRCT